MKKRNRKIRSAMAAALAVSMVTAPCSSALAASTSDEITQREIARQLGISRSYVSRIEKSAIEKLRAYF